VIGRRVTIRFDEIVVKGVFRWKAADGKTRQETKRFSQTVNPFNKNSAGLVKTAGEIQRELMTERDLWLLQRRNDITEANHV